MQDKLQALGHACAMPDLWLDSSRRRPSILGPVSPPAESLSNASGSQTPSDWMVLLPCLRSTVRSQGVCAILSWPGALILQGSCQTSGWGPLAGRIIHSGPGQPLSLGDSGACLLLALGNPAAVHTLALGLVTASGHGQCL